MNELATAVPDAIKGKGKATSVLVLQDLRECHSLRQSSVIIQRAHRRTVGRVNCDDVLERTLFRGGHIGELVAEATA